MWKYVKGVPRPNPEKRKADKADRNDYFVEYERKRARNFNSKWTVDRPWLLDTEAGMVCKSCKHYHSSTSDPKSSFIKGCQSYKLDAIVKHEESKMHVRSIQIEEQLQKPIQKSDAANILVTLNKCNAEKLEKMFRTCHALVLKNRPISDFMWHNDLDEKKGLHLGTTYRNRESSKEFVQAISETEFKKVSSTISKAKFVCVIGDGSTDSSIKEQEMWFIRSCTSGVVNVHFAGVHSTDKANAENLVIGLQTVVQENLKIQWNDFKSKLVALSCDGASVNTGNKGGVGALLKNQQPDIIVIHCMAHRLELSLKDVLKKIPLYQKVVGTLLKGLFYFYHNSALNMAMLRNAYKALKQDGEKLLIPTRTDGTRWVGHQLLAVKNVLTSYKFIVGHMEQVTLLYIS